MEETDFKKQYEEILATYTQKRGQNQTAEREIKVTNEDLQELTLKISSITLPAAPPSPFPRKEALQQQHQQLQQQLQALAQQLQTVRQQLLDPLKAQLSQIPPLSEGISSSSKHQLEKQLSQLQESVSSLEQQLQQRQTEFSNHLNELKPLENTLSQISSAIVGQEHIDFSPLQLELKQLEQEEKQLANVLSQERQALQNKQKDIQTHAQQKQDRLLQIKVNNSNLQNTLTCLQSAPQQKIDSASSQEISQLEQKHRSVLKDLDDLTKEVAIKKIEEGKRKQQIAKEKQKPKRNFKNEILEEQKKKELYLKDLEREQNKLDNTIKLRKTYVSQQSLTILQKEYERQQMKGKPNLETEEGTRKKVVRENQMIKARITYLKHASKELEEQSQEKLNLLKQKSEELVKQKLNYEKLYSDNNYKLNEYMKNFPNHEQVKEDLKNEEKRKKQELKEKLKKEQQTKIIQKKKDKIEEEQKVIHDETQTSWEKWDKWDADGNLPKKDEASIFNNRQFQIAAGVIALIAIILLSFN